MTNLLYSADNTKGVFLEDLITAVMSDLEIKSSKISHLTDISSKNYVQTNKAIIALLSQAKVLQESALKFAETNSLLEQYTFDGIVVLAAPMTYTDYVVGREELPKANFGDNFTEEGWYIVTDKGRPNHREWWLPNVLFEEFIK